MLIEISDNTFKQILNKVIESSKFKEGLQRQINTTVETAKKDILNRTYDRGFNDGLSSRRKK